ncbi:MAG: BrnA antitoxin family protein [Pseudomonadota bacterium]
MKSGHTIRVTLNEARKLRGKTNWDNLPADEDIDTSDIPEWTQEMFDNAQLIAPGPKKSIHLRVDEDIFAFFKDQGPGHLTRMHAVLRAYVDAQTPKKEDKQDEIGTAEAAE